MPANLPSPFDFTEPPAIGLTVRCKLPHSQPTWLTLIAVEPYTRKDGTPSFILRWRAPNGRTGTTGLRSSSINWGGPLPSELEAWQLQG